MLLADYTVMNDECHHKCSTGEFFLQSEVGCQYIVENRTASSAIEKYTEPIEFKNMVIKHTLSFYDKIVRDN